MIMPERSASTAASGANGCDSRIRTVAGVDHVDPGHRQQLALALGALEGTVPVQGLLDRLGVQRRVVVEPHPLAGA
jgi:hypothetical protein